MLFHLAYNMCCINKCYGVFCGSGHLNKSSPRDPTGPVHKITLMRHSIYGINFHLARGHSFSRLEYFGKRTLS